MTADRQSSIAQTSPLPLGTLWVGSELRWLDRLSLHSFVAQGHAVTLFYTHDMKDPGIEGVSLRPAREAFEYPDGMQDALSPSVFADIFRVNMMRTTGLTWVDTDIICLHPLLAKDGYLIGYEQSGMINNAVMCLPADSPAFAILLTTLNDPSSVPEWLPRHKQAEVRNAAKDQRLYEAARLIPNALGPRALTYTLQSTGEETHALPEQVLNPVPWGLVDILFNPHGGVEGWTTPLTRAVHLYASRIRQLHKRLRPYPNSFVGQIATDIGFDFRDLPKR